MVRHLVFFIFKGKAPASVEDIVNLANLKSRLICHRRVERD